MTLVKKLFALGIGLSTYCSTTLAQKVAPSPRIKNFKLINGPIKPVDSVLSAICGREYQPHTNTFTAPNGNRVGYSADDKTFIVVGPDKVTTYSFLNGKVTECKSLPKPKHSKIPLNKYIAPFQVDKTVNELGLEIKVPKPEQENVTNKFCELIGATYNPIK